jgi:16S rRNA (guanine527-N7)-methyltransferase
VPAAAGPPRGDVSGTEPTLDLLDVLDEARALGFLGPGPLEPHLALALALAGGCPDEPTLAVDLGSGAGLPGLVLARHWPRSRWLLVDSNERRTTFLVSAVERLLLDDRVSVLRARAEELGRRPEQRAKADLVVARSFGRPPVTAECGAPLLRVGGRLVVSEPPGAPPNRWPADSLAELGLELVDRAVSPSAWVSLRQRTLCPPTYPRRVGLPAKRPLF